MKTFVSAVQTNGDGAYHVIRPNNWRSLTVAQIQTLSNRIKNTSGAHRCLVDVRNSQILVYFAPLPDPKRVRVLKSVLRVLAEVKLHNPLLGIESDVPGLG